MENLIEDKKEEILERDYTMYKAQIIDNHSEGYYTDEDQEEAFNKAKEECIKEIQAMEF